MAYRIPWIWIKRPGYPTYRLGLIGPSPDDVRDYHPLSEKLPPTISAITKPIMAQETFSKAFELDIPWDTRLDQLKMQTCTANAFDGVYQYLQWLVYGRITPMSRLYNYYCSRYLAGLLKYGDVGSYLRATIGAARHFGSVEESVWPYDPASVNANPGWEVAKLADAYKDGFVYWRLDQDGLPGVEGTEIIRRMKAFISSKLPPLFGFTTYATIWQSIAETGTDICFPAQGESSGGGHGVYGCGWDDEYIITHPITKQQWQGAFTIMSSWGTGVGDGGKFRLPYEYVLTRAANDVWNFAGALWNNLNQFLPVSL